MSHELTKNNLLDRVYLYETVQKCNEIKPFLKRVITGEF